MAVLTEEFSQNLVSAAIDQELTFVYDVKVMTVEFHATASITEEVQIIHKTASGTEYLRDTKQMSSDTDFFFAPVGDIIIKKGDSLKITATNANTTGTLNVLATVTDKVI